MTNGGEHGLYLPGAAEPHVQVYEERVLWFKLAQRSGGCGDLIGFRSEQPLIRCPTYHKIITSALSWRNPRHQTRVSARYQSR